MKKIINKIGALKNAEKALIKSVISFFALGFAICLFIYNLLITKNWLSVCLYGLVSCSFSLMFISFCSQYRRFIFLEQFAGGKINDKKN
jgi:hypothetical protein